MKSPDLVLNGSYDYLLVALSVLIAILASYAALDLAGRVTLARGKVRFLWLNGGAWAMGFGIWSMHYVGMLAFRLPVPVQYDWPTVLLSLFAAIFASGVALFVVSRSKMGLIRASIGSIVMGAGIAAMHYIGMAAMRLQAMCHYSLTLVTLSVFLAIVISFVALCLTFYFRRETKAWNWKKILSAVVMGAAIPVMHYTAMAAASFVPSSSDHQDLSHAVNVSSLSAAGIVIVAVVVLGFVPLTSLTLDSLSDTRQLAARYFLSLGGISVLAILGTLLVQHQGRQSQSDARVVNIAGRQRMLSQAIAKDALLLVGTRDHGERQRLAEDLRTIEATWERSHSALIDGDPWLEVPGTSNPEIRRKFAALESDYDAMVRATQTILTKLSLEQEPMDVSGEVNAILAHEGPYLQAMNEIVFQYDAEAATRDRGKNRLYFSLLVFILAVLLLQGLLVLRPALVRIQQGISQLELAKQDLHRKATFVELLQVVAVAANEATSVEAALQFTLGRVCEHTGWPVGHVYFSTGETGSELVSSKLWHFDDASEFATFRQITERTPLAIGRGLPGRVADSGKPVWIPDIYQDKNFPRREAALDLGVKGAFGFPVLMQNEVVAVLEFFSGKIEEPDDELLNVMSNVGAQLGQVVERQRAVEALRDAETRYRVLVEQLPAVPYVAEPGPSGEWLYVSPQIESMLGFSPAEWTADRHLWFRQLHPEDREEVLAEEKAGETRGEPFHFEYRLFALDNRVVWIHDACTLVHDAKSGRSVQRGVLFDISERKQAQQELACKAEELARSNAELEQFAYVASHDLQEPLRMVASYTQLLARRYKGKLNAEADEFIGFAVDGANRMQQLIQDLLSYSRVTTKGQQLQPVDAKACCEAAIRNLQKSIEDAQAEVRVGPMPVISGDPTQMTQLFQNLIGNAIKYRNERKPEIHVGANSNGNKWIFSVQDNGIGIEPQYFERIFQMFQRLHTRKEFSGTGIGLAVCRKIVQRHGGRIWVESQLGQGSNFLFTIPRAERIER